MAFEKMNRFLIITLKSDLKHTMKNLQVLKAVEIENTKPSTTDAGDRCAKIQSEIDKRNKAIEILKSYSTDKHLKKLKECPANIVDKTISAEEQINILKNDNTQLEKEISSLLPYHRLDIPINSAEVMSLTTKTGYLPALLSKETLQEMYSFAYFEILKHEHNKTYIWAVYPAKYEKEFEKSGFVQFKFQTADIPRDYIERLKDKIKANNLTILALQENLEEYSQFSSSISIQEFLHAKERLEEARKLRETGETVLISGYVPEKYQDKIINTLKNVYIEFYPGDDNAPVLFKNNFFASPVEGITQSYTMPSPRDIDPNSIMSFFYYLFFGMMFSDAGYGLLMIAVCGYSGFINPSKHKKMMQMFFFCGISTFVWGLMYGSFFGNVITSVAETFFGRNIILKPIWINPTSEPLKLLIFSITLGFIQILTGLFIRLYVKARYDNWKNAFMDTGSWIVALLGLGILSAAIAYPALMNVGIVLTVTGILALVLTQGRSKKNVFSKLLSGLLSLYNITSYVSDILSYSRLMALGLATGVIAQVINILGSLGGSSFVGVIMYTAVFVVGHSLNFAINMLGAYVHTNRLQYVEFYSKFYEGGGRPFIPFGGRY